MTLPAREPLDVCGDCGARAGHGSIMWPLRKPGGWWALCNACMLRSLADARDTRERIAKKLAALEGKQRKTHLKKRVGAHQDEAPDDDIFAWSESA